MANRVMWIVWPAFLAACVLELLVFAVVDPQDLHWGDQALGLSRQAVYTGAFYQLFTPFALLSGVLSVALLVMHGAVLLAWRSEDPIAGRARGWARLAALLAIVLFVLGVRALTGTRGWLLLVFCFAPIIGELLVSLRRPIFYDRTLIFASLTYYLVLAAGLDAALSRLTRRPAIALVTLVTFFNVLALRNYLVYAKKEEWNLAAAYVTRHLAPGEPVLFNATWAQIPFEYYARGGPKLELHGLPVDLFDRHVLEPEFEPRDLPVLTAAIAGKPSVWLIYSHEFFTDPNHLIPQELERVYATKELREFFGVRVIHYSDRRE